MDTSSRAKERFATEKIRNIFAIPNVLRELGADAAAVMRRAGVDPKLFANPESVIPFAALRRHVTESVRAGGCETFGPKAEFSI